MTDALEGVLSEVRQDEERGVTAHRERAGRLVPALRISF